MQGMHQMQKMVIQVHIHHKTLQRYENAVTEHYTFNKTQCKCGRFQLRPLGCHVWEVSSQTIMPEGGCSHIEAHGFSLITTASHEESYKMPSFHQLTVTVTSVMLCGKIIALILCYSDNHFSRFVSNMDASLSFQFIDYHLALFNSAPPTSISTRKIIIIVWVRWASYLAETVIRLY